MEGFGGQEPFRRAFGGHFRAFGGRPPIGGQFGDYELDMVSTVSVISCQIHMYIGTCLFLADFANTIV